MNTRNTLNIEILVVYYIYPWSMTSNFTISFTEDFKLKLQESSGTSPATQNCVLIYMFMFLCNFLGDQKDGCFSST